MRDTARTVFRAAQDHVSSRFVSRSAVPSRKAVKRRIGLIPPVRLPVQAPLLWRCGPLQTGRGRQASFFRRYSIPERLSRGTRHSRVLRATGAEEPMDVGVSLAGSGGLGASGCPTRISALANLSGQSPAKGSGASSGSRSGSARSTFASSGLPHTNDAMVESAGCPDDDHRARCRAADL